MTRILLITSLLVGLNLSIAAQETRRTPLPSTLRNTPQEASSFLSGFDKRFALMDSLIFNDSIPQAVVIPHAHFVKSERVQEVDDVVQAQAEAYISKTGLEISGQIYGRPGEGIGYDPDDPLAAYFGKAQAELQWHIFQSSLYKRANRLQELKLRGDIDQLAFEKESIARTITNQKIASRRKHDAVLSGLLRYHYENINLLTDAQAYLLANGKISSDDLLKLLSDKAEIDRQLTTILSDTAVTEQITAPNVVYFDTDSAALITHIAQSHLDLRRLDLEMELNDCRRDATDYVGTLSVSPFARYSFYLRNHAKSSQNVDVGVSFKIPLSSETTKQRKALEAERRVIARRQEDARQQILHEVQLILLELRGYNQNIYGEYERMKELKSYINMRTNSYENRVGEYNRLSRLQEYNAYLAAWERLVSFEYQRDSKLIDLQSYVMDQPVSNFVKFIPLK